jgi:hypothetical protein
LTQRLNNIGNTERREWLTELVHEKLGERRFYALAAAVREHEARAAAFPHTIGRHDEILYERLRLICGEL